MLPKKQTLLYSAFPHGMVSIMCSKKLIKNNSKTQNSTERCSKIAEHR